MIDLDAIQARADAATPGPWFIDPSDGRTYAWVCESADGLGNDPLWLISADSNVIPDDEDVMADAEHIVGMDPPTVLALVAELRAAREVIKAAKVVTKDGFICAQCWEEDDTTVPEGTNCECSCHTEKTALQKAIAAYDKVAGEVRDGG